MPEASLRSVVNSPPRAPLSQSWGRTTWSTRPAQSGLFCASHASLEMVNEATGTRLTASTHASGPSSARSRAASAALRVSFHSRASWTGVPELSRATIPCCWAAMPAAATEPPSRSAPAERHASRNAEVQTFGSTAVRSGWAAAPDAMTSPLWASTARTLQDWVEESTPMTVLIGSSPRRSGQLGPGPAAYQ